MYIPNLLRTSRLPALSSKSSDMLQVAPSKAIGLVGSFFYRLLQKLANCRGALSKARISFQDRKPQDYESEFSWLEAYKAALLEFDERRLPATIDAAMQAIEDRRRALSRRRDTVQERHLLEHAALSLWAMRASRSSHPLPPGRAPKAMPGADNDSNAAA